MKEVTDQTYLEARLEDIARRLPPACSLVDDDVNMMKLFPADGASPASRYYHRVTTPPQYILRLSLKTLPEEDLQLARVLCMIMIVLKVFWLTERLRLSVPPHPTPLQSLHFEFIVVLFCTRACCALVGLLQL